MKITKAQLKRIIKEEVNTLLKEGDPAHEASDIYRQELAPYHQALARWAAVDPPLSSMMDLEREPEKEKEEDDLKDYYDALRQRTKHDDALRQRTKHDDLTENIENLTVENMLMAIEALSQMAVTIGIPVGLSGMVFNKLRKYIASKNETPI